MKRYLEAILAGVAGGAMVIAAMIGLTWFEDHYERRP